MAADKHDHPASDPPAQSAMEEPTYLFACRSNETLGPSCAFYLAANRTLAESLERMFASQFAEPNGWSFSHVLASVIPLEQQVLLDESIQWLDVNGDPDPTVYDTELSESTIQRAAFSRQAAGWEELLRAKSRETRAPEPEVKPSPSALADASLLAMILRDALFVQLDYPEAGALPQHVALMKDVRERLDRALDQDGMFRLKKLAASTSSIADLADPLRWGKLAAAAAMEHPQFGEGSEGKLSDDQLCAATERSLRLCQSSASPEVRALSDRIGEFMMVSCRRPTGGHDPSFKDPARAAHVFDRYWRLANALLQAQMSVHVGYYPHPLTRIIENLRDRISGCMEILRDQPNAAKVAEDLDGMLSMLTEGDIDDLHAVDEWVHPAIRRVELFVTRMGMSLGVWHGNMTQAETYFLDFVQIQIAEYKADVTVKWQRMVKRADAIGAKRNAERQSAPASPPSAGSADGAAPADSKSPPPPPPPLPPVRKGPRVVLQQRGEPCIVDGKEMPPLTDGRYAVVEALIKAGEDGLTKDAIEAVRKGARKMLEQLSAMPGWADVVQMAGQTNGRYRIRL